MLEKKEKVAYFTVNMHEAWNFKIKIDKFKVNKNDYTHMFNQKSWLDEWRHWSIEQMYSGNKK